MPDSSLLLQKHKEFVVDEASSAAVLAKRLQISKKQDLSAYLQSGRMEDQRSRWSWHLNLWQLEWAANLRYLSLTSRHLIPIFF